MDFLLVKLCHFCQQILQKAFSKFSVGIVGSAKSFEPLYLCLNVINSKNVVNNITFLLHLKFFALSSQAKKVERSYKRMSCDNKIRYVKIR